MHGKVKMKVFEYSLESLKSKNSKFDEILKEKWKNYMNDGNFRYSVENLPRKVLGGRFNFVAEMQQNRAVNRRPPQYMTDVVQQFDDEKFNFTKIDKDKELIFLLRRINDDRKDEDAVIINVSPVNEYHSLLLPQSSLKLPQVLTEYSLILALETAFMCSDEDLRLCFNSLCAYASVNHLHWHIIYLREHLFIQSAPLTATDTENVYILSDDVYPAPAFVFTVPSPKNINNTAKTMFRVISFLLKENIAHNIYIARETGDNVGSLRVFLWPRISVVGAKSSDSFVMAVLELAGQILIFQPQMYDDIDENMIVNAQKETVVPVFNEIKSTVLRILKES